MEKKMISPQWCIGNCPSLCTIFFKTSTWYLKCMLYDAAILIVLVYFSPPPFVCPNYALEAFKAVFVTLMGNSTGIPKLDQNFFFIGNQ